MGKAKPEKAIKRSKRMKKAKAKAKSKSKSRKRRNSNNENLFLKIGLERYEKLRPLIEKNFFNIKKNVRNSVKNYGRIKKVIGESPTKDGKIRKIYKWQWIPTPEMIQFHEEIFNADRPHVLYASNLSDGIAFLIVDELQTKLKKLEEVMDKKKKSGIVTKEDIQELFKENTTNHDMFSVPGKFDLKIYN